MERQTDRRKERTHGASGIRQRGAAHSPGTAKREGRGGRGRRGTQHHRRHRRRRLLRGRSRHAPVEWLLDQHTLRAQGVCSVRAAPPLAAKPVAGALLTQEWGSARGCGRPLGRTDRCVLASSGFYGDIIQLNKRLKIRIEVRGERVARTRTRTLVRGGLKRRPRSSRPPRLVRPAGRLQQYFHQHNKQISTPALAQMLSNTLYYKRFFPYYSFNIVGGLDEQGRSGPAWWCRTALGPDSD